MLRLKLLGVSGGKTMDSWAGDGPNCVVKALARCAFRLVGTGSRAERLDFVTGPWLFRSFVLW